MLHWQQSISQWMTHTWYSGQRNTIAYLPHSTRRRFLLPKNKMSPQKKRTDLVWRDWIDASRVSNVAVPYTDLRLHTAVEGTAADNAGRVRSAATPMEVSRGGRVAAATTRDLASQGHTVRSCSCRDLPPPPRPPATPPCSVPHCRWGAWTALTVAALQASTAPLSLPTGVWSGVLHARSFNRFGPLLRPLPPTGHASRPQQPLGRGDPWAAADLQPPPPFALPCTTAPFRRRAPSRRRRRHRRPVSAANTHCGLPPPMHAHVPRVTREVGEGGRDGSVLWLW